MLSEPLFLYGAVVLNFKSAALTSDLVKQLTLVNNSLLLKVYVVDNSCCENEWAALQSLLLDCSPVELIKSESNEGYGAGNRIGVQKAVEDGCRGVLISNPDVGICDRDFFIRFNYELEKSNWLQDRPLMAAPMVINPFLKSEENPIYFPEFFREPFFLPNQSKNIFSFCGCFFFLNLAAIKILDHFPTDVFMYNEELIIGSKLRDNDAVLLFLEELIVHHNHDKKIGRLRAEINRKYHQIVSRVVVFNRYFSGSFSMSMLLSGILVVRSFALLLVKWCYTFLPKSVISFFYHRL